MKTLSILCSVWLFVGCQSTNNAPPPVTLAMTNAGQRNHADLSTLNEGRRLFVSRCIECHTLPPHWHYSAKDWPGIVDSMAHRANLKRDERNAIVAYILAARRQ